RLHRDEHSSARVALGHPGTGRQSTLLLFGVTRLRTVLIVRLGGADSDRRRIRNLDRFGLATEGEVRTVRLFGLAVPTLDIDDDDLTGVDLTEENLLGQRVLDLALDGPPQWPGTQHRVEAAFGDQRLR